MNCYQKLSRLMFLPFVLQLLLPSWSMRAQSAVVPLRLEDSLPDVVGENLLGSPTHLLTVTTGKIAVVVFSFTNSGGKDAELWNRELLRDFGSNRSVALSSVIMLESAPRFIRGFIVSGIRKDMPASLQSGAIVSYENEKLWKQRLAVTDDKHAYVLLLGRDSRIRWMNPGGFGDADYRKLATEIQKQIQSAAEHAEMR
ncbi:MAG: hypothetical protein ABSC48_11285 [Terracidiphilus sp.]